MDTNPWQKVEAEAGETWDFEATPEIQGILIRKEEHVGPNDSNMYRLQIESDTEGTKEIGIWGNTVLDGRFKKVEVGEEVKIEYLGKEKSPKTGREYHSFEVYHRLAPMKKVN